MMQVVLFTFVIGMLNVALGYAIAVYLGLGPSSLADAWRRLGSAQPRLGSAQPIGKISDDRRNVIGEPVQQPRHEQQAASPPDAAPSAAPEETSLSITESAGIDLDTFRRFVAISVSSLTDFAARLKRSNRGDHQRTPWAFVAELQGICQPYLEKLRQATQRLSDQLRNQVQELVLEQTAQLETTLGNLQYMDFGSGASAAIARLSQETANTLSMARKLQQALEPAPETSDQKASEESPPSVQPESAVAD